MTVTPDELRAALKYAPDEWDEDREMLAEYREHWGTLAAAYQEAVEALREARDELAYMYANYHEHVRQADKDGDAGTIARLDAVLAKAKEAGAAVYGGDAAMDAIRAEERERIAQMVRETWFKLPGDDQESHNYRRGIYEGIRRVADAIRSMK